MARYDRIAPLTPPSRDTAFPAWQILRDLDGIDRDAELARRARLRFLAIRPLRRLLDHGNAVGRESYRAQIEAVREELGYLPSRDIERVRLARFLHSIEERDTTLMVHAAIEMAEGCIAAGQLFGAEEFALTALGIANADNHRKMQLAANIALARVYRTRAQWEDAARYGRAAVVLAEELADYCDLVRARSEEALAAAARGDGDLALKILDATLTRVQAAKDRQAEALTEARLSACKLALGNTSGALDHGWTALRLIDDARERNILLENVGNAFAALGLHRAAERCFTMVSQRGVDPALRARARASQAVAAAANGAQQSFRDRRVSLLNDTAEWSADPRVFAFVHLALGRGSVIVGDIDFAREHLREAITCARKHSLDDILNSAANVLSMMEQTSARELIAPVTSGPAADAARRIAEQIETMPDLAVAQ